ncbi:MAG: glycosyltransferase family 4 protein [Bacteroidales bacterium]|jgi:glycosyltransferase involved in cell wall biosynthesis|nr:glycosyltransferase family 4 protein [Bacteroidales bacterium]
MKILLLSTSEQHGGAAIAANRLMHALNKSGHEAKMLVRDKQTDDENVVSINTNRLKRKINFIRFVYERCVIFVHNRFNRTNLFAVSIANTGTDISKHPLVKEADIIHLHWINQGFLSLTDIRKLTESGKPVVWTMHDMWPCTGICHHARTCNNYQSKCQSCFFLQSKKRDLSSLVFSRKKAIMEKSDIIFAGCSKWLSKQAQKSMILANKRIVTIPNPIDTSLFYPVKDIPAARKKMGLPLTGNLLLFGALNVSDKRKGIDYLLKALHLMDTHICTGLVVFGQVKKEIKSLFRIPVYSMGYITDETQVNLLYNAVDLFVTSSLEENLPNTIMEAMACGIPCVGFNVGGIPEMIDHQVNGYVAEYKSSEDLAAGINWCLNSENRGMLSEQALMKANSHYAEKIVAKQYIKLYIN